MASNDKFKVTVYLVHGEPLRFEVELTEAKEIGLGGDIENSLNRNAMAIELDGNLLMIPYSNIQYMEVEPAPESLPLTMIKNAKSLNY